MLKMNPLARNTDVSLFKILIKLIKLSGTVDMYCKNPKNVINFMLKCVHFLSRNVQLGSYLQHPDVIHEVILHPLV